MRRSWIIAGGIAAAIAVIAIAAGIALRLHRPKSTPPPAPPVPVATEADLTGRVEPRTLVPVGAPVAGAIDAYYLDVGQEVYKDQLLGRIRDEDLESAAQQAQLALDTAQTRVTTLDAQQLQAKLEVSRAEADRSRAHSDLDHLEKEYQRQKGLWDVGATPRLVYEKAEKDYNTARDNVEKLDSAAKDAAARASKIASDLEAANRASEEANKGLDQAKADLNRGEIHSPVDGIVAARKGAPGEPVNASATDLFEIATDLTQLQVRLTADPARIHAGQTASVRVPELSPEPIPGTVREVQGSQATVDFTSPQPITKLGLNAQVKIKY